LTDLDAPRTVPGKAHSWEAGHEAGACCRGDGRGGACPDADVSAGGGDPLPYTPGAVGSTIPSGQRGAIHMSASYWKLIGLEIVHGPYAIYCDGCGNNTFDRLATHDNYETGFQLQGSSAGNLIVNLDSYNNRDPRKNGESADGLGIK
jgi:hypothetical protein